MWIDDGHMWAWTGKSGYFGDQNKWSNPDGLQQNLDNENVFHQHKICYQKVEQIWMNTNQINKLEHAEQSELAINWGCL